MEIFKLFGSILVENDKANKSLDETDKKGMGVAKTFGGMIGTAAKVGTAVVAGMAVAGGAILAVTTKASEAASAINDMSVRTGLSTDQLQELKFATEQVGVNFESITNASARLTNVMSDASNGNKTATAAFEKLGVAVTNSDGSLRSMDSTFPEVIAKLADMENKSERNALAFDLFGKGAVELVPLLDQGSGGIEELTKKAHDLGLVMDEEAIAAGDQFGDTLDALKASFGAVGNELGVMFMPVLQSLMDWVLEHMPEIRAVVETVFTVFGEVVGKTVEVLTKLYNFAEPSFPIIGAIIKTAFEDITSFVQTGIDIFDKLTSSIKTALKWLGMYKDEKESTTFTGGSGNTHGGGGQAFANGTDFAPGGRALVGERGPEIVDLPRGSKVYTAEETAAILGDKEITIVNYTVLDGKVVAKSTSKEQSKTTNGKSRALGVVPV